ncbi:AtzE family amidohydrolase [Parvibaculum sedimenti]|uniref:AtzE family amidohydrolase n=1 Tax=Parvibaculum sedimenti TaxID=2608632 RepID=A0A6N6VJX9_9HYPH|nr:AtzE family amidohydrolase [Parvibaculum sedimenti]KAB7741728.1 AtzE family amidohydrolase [Parvibaculum sedimenti]
MTPVQGSAAEIAASVRSGATSASDVLAAAKARIESADGVIKAFTDLTLERAERQAQEIDAAIAVGRDPGPLAGVPFAVKNLFDIKGLPTRAGSKINRDRTPAIEDAVLIRRLTKAGAVLIGGLNMGEYAYDFTGENVHDGICCNPRNTDHMSGGSSSGSGAAVAAGMVPLALGSDTNGSIRVPSALCGIFGLKPTYGRLPRSGTFPFCDSLDHLGPLARSAQDLALSFDVMQGHDAHDVACARKPSLETTKTLEAGANDLRIAVAGDYFTRGAKPEALEAVAKAASALSVTREVVIPEAARGRAAAFVITTSESSALHIDRLRMRAADFDPDTRYRFLSGALVPAAWYIKAQRFRRWYHDQVIALFKDVDIILAPATPCAAPKIGEKLLTLGEETVPLRPNLGLFTQPISCIGFPVVVAPIQREDDLPLGVQIIAAPWREDLALRVAAELQRLGVAAAPVATGV